MTVKASGRSLIIAAGIWACFSAPLQAAGSPDRDVTAVSKAGSKATGAPIVLKKFAKQRHAKKLAQPKSSKLAQPAADKKAADAADDNVENSTAIPASVANANARFASADSPTGTAKAMSARASTILQAAADDIPPAADSQVVAADELNELDRALQETKPPARTMTLASAEAAPAAAASAAPAAPVMASSSNESTAWDQTSLIGKIFIAFGGLLTLASAARMFMA